MRYAFTLDGRTHHVTVEEHADGPRFVVDGDTFTPDVDADGRTVTVRVGDDSFTFDLGNEQVHLGPNVLDVQVQRAKPVLLRAGGKGRKASGQVKPPMPGKVVEVHVREGDQVNEGDPLLVLEAMKMQNDLKSPIAGTVQKVQVKPGQNVEAATVMVVIEPESTD